jgi:hypothetical protein
MKPIHYVVLVCAAIMALAPPLLKAFGPSLPNEWAGLAPSILAVVSAIYVEAKQKDGGS